MATIQPPGLDPRPPSTARASQVDGLRFLAFFAVFLYHFKEEACPWGWVGLQFFFTLSGFLITRILVKAESGAVSADLRRFYVRRTLRIFPLYYAIVALVALAGREADFVGLWTFTYNMRAYFARNLSGEMGHFWTLCVEEQFYLIWPPILLLTPPRLRLAVVSALIAGSKAFQVHANQSLAMPWARVLLPYCGEGLLWGGLAGLIEMKTKPGRREGTACFLAGLPALVLGWQVYEHRPPFEARVQEVASFSLFGVGCALVVFGAWRSRARWIVGPLSFAPVAYLGRISYGLYAFHHPGLASPMARRDPLRLPPPQALGRAGLDRRPGRGLLALLRGAD